MLAVALMGSLWAAARNLMPGERDRSLGDTLRRALHFFFWACVVVLVVQQMVLLYETWGRKQQALIMAKLMYEEEECATYPGRSQPRIEQCQRDNITINTWPITLALMEVINSWNSCLYLSCPDLIMTVVANWQYKVLFIVLSLGALSYIISLLSFTKKKSKKWQSPQEQALFFQQALQSAQLGMQKKQKLGPHTILASPVDGDESSL